MAGGEVTRVELGTGRRRLWPVVAGAVAAWVLLAAVLGGGDDPDAAPPTSASATTSAPDRVSSTTTTDLVDAAPLLGRATGWLLVVADHGDGSLRVLELDTGEIRPVAAAGLFGPALADGVFTQDHRGGVLFLPSPFEPGVEIYLGPAAGGGIFPVPGADTAWLVLGESAAVNDVRLVSLVDGAPLRSLELPADSRVVGVTSGDGELVVAAGGDAFRVGRDGVPEVLTTGQPIAVLRDELLAQTCDEQLRCGVVAVDVASGRTRALPGVPAGESVVLAGPAHPDGRLVVSIGDPRRPAGDHALLGPDGPVPLLPAGYGAAQVWSGAWSPDGALFFVVHGGGVRVVDPFAPAGPAEVASFRVRGTPAAGQLAVVEPR